MKTQTLTERIAKVPEKDLRIAGISASVVLLLLSLISFLAAQPKSDQNESLMRVNNEIAIVEPEVAALKTRENELFFETGFSDEYFDAANQTAAQAFELTRLEEAKAELEKSGFKVSVIGIVLLILAILPVTLGFTLPKVFQKP